MSAISFSQATQLTINYLQWLQNSQPVAMRGAPTIVFDMRTWSVNDMLNQVRMQTAVGQRYVSYHVKSLGTYVISG